MLSQTFREPAGCLHSVSLNRSTTAALVMVKRAAAVRAMVDLEKCIVGLGFGENWDLERVGSRVYLIWLF